MICAKFVRTQEGYTVDAEWGGYGNANIIEAFNLHGVDIEKELDKMAIGESKIYNIDWKPNNVYEIIKRGIESKVVTFGNA